MTVIALGFSAALVLTSSRAEALDINYPGDPSCNTAKECADLICTAGGGTLTIDAGVFNETLQTQAGCQDLLVMGQGGGQTVFLGDGVFTNGAPLVTIGDVFPALPQPTSQRVRITGLTIRCNDPDACTGEGLGAGRSNDSRLDHNEIENFSLRGITASGNTNLEVDHNTVTSTIPGADNTSAFRVVRFGPLSPGGSGYDIHHNTFQDYDRSMLLSTGTTNSEISHNNLLGGSDGLFVFQASGLTITNNNIAHVNADIVNDGVVQGMLILFMSNSFISQNVICEIEGSAINFLGVNSNNTFLKNDLLGFDDGPISGNSSGNTFIKNDTDPNGTCPSL